MNKKKILVTGLALSFAIAPISAFADGTAIQKNGDTKAPPVRVEEQMVKSTVAENKAKEKQQDAEARKITNDKTVKKTENNGTKQEYRTIEDYLQANGINYYRKPDTLKFSYVDKDHPYNIVQTSGKEGEEKINTDSSVVRFNYFPGNGTTTPRQGSYTLSIYPYDVKGSVINKEYFSSTIQLFYGAGRDTFKSLWDGNVVEGLNYNSITKTFVDGNGKDNVQLTGFFKNNVKRGQVVLNIFDKTVDVAEMRKIEPNDTKWPHAIVYEFDLTHGTLTPVNEASKLGDVLITQLPPDFNPNFVTDQADAFGRRDGEDIPTPPNPYEPGGNVSNSSHATNNSSIANQDRYASDRATTQNVPNQSGKQTGSSDVSTGDNTNLVTLGLGILLAQLGIVGVLRKKKLSTKGDRLS